MQDICVKSGYRISKQENGVLVATFEDSYEKFYATTDECADFLKESVPVRTFKSPNGTKVIITIDTEKYTIEMVRK